MNSRYIYKEILPATSFHAIPFVRSIRNLSRSFIRRRFLNENKEIATRLVRSIIRTRGDKFVRYIIEVIVVSHI